MSAAEQSGNSGIDLPPSLRTLAERLAEREYGSEQRPVPWHQLPEPARQSLVTPLARTLQAVLGLGYRISPVESDAASAEVSGDEVAACRTSAEGMLRQGEPLLAYNLVQEGLEKWPRDLRLRQLQGLALARSGAVLRAKQTLETLRAEGHCDGETLGLLARTHKDLALLAPHPEQRAESLAAAFRLYEDAYLAADAAGRVGEAYYTGINAATLALLRGDAARARQVAHRVHELCTAELAREGENGGGAYWLRATLGEAALVAGDLEQARTHYRRAAQLAGSRFADVASTRRQARLILSHIGQDQTWLEEALAVPPVLVFTGHMVDRPNRPSPRFPPLLEPVVRDEIRAYLDRFAPAAAYGSAACGADILCLEAMLERGAEVNVVLPFPPDQFRATSVDLVPGGDWSSRFDRVLASASSLTVVSDHGAESSGSAYEYANLVLTGMAMLRAGALATPVHGLAVWDGGSGGGLGGTTGVVERWRDLGLEVEHVDTTRLLRQVGTAPTPLHPPAETAVAAPEAPAAAGFSHEIRAMLFADAVGYSKLTENQVRLFIEHFLGAVAGLNRRTAAPPIHMEVAGDGLYFVFATAGDAGRYGLGLSELVTTTDWVRHGLPETMNMRVGLHCGPVFACRDPITGGPMFTGPHTSRTARIEPITPPGQVYASSAFAAVAAATGVTDLVFSYIGRTSLAKKYGALALYHVQRPPR